VHIGARVAHQQQRGKGNGQAEIEGYALPLQARIAPRLHQ